MFARFLRRRRSASEKASRRIVSKDRPSSATIEPLEQRTFLDALTNTAPVVHDISVGSKPGAAQVFSAANFTGAYSDADGESLAKIQIVSLPANGRLFLYGVPVAAGQEIGAASLGGLSYRPNRRFELRDSFTWNASDSFDYAGVPANVALRITAPLPKALKATEYFPLTGASWSYAMQQDGTSLDCDRTVTRAKAGGMTGYLVKDTFYGGGQRGSQTRTYSLSSTTGLRIHAQTNALAKTTLRSPLPVLKGTFKIGDTLRWSDVGISGSINLEGTTIKASGTDSGYSKVLRAETVYLNNGALVLYNAIKISIVHTQVLRGTYEGVSGTLTAQLTETAWLVRDVGLVRGAVRMVATLKPEGYPAERATIVNTQALVRSNRLVVESDSDDWY